MESWEIVYIALLLAGLGLGVLSSPYLGAALIMVEMILIEYRDIKRSSKANSDYSKPKRSKSSRE